MNTSGKYPFWAKRREEVFEYLRTSPSGLTGKEATSRKERAPKIQSPLIQNLRLFLSQYKSPLLLLLVFALLLSSVFGDYKQSTIIFGILFISSMLSFIWEKRSNQAAEKLRRMVKTTARVKRDGKILEIPVEGVVPGDIVLLKAGDIIPADSLIIDLRDLYVNESVFTGESFPSEKRICKTEENTPINKRRNSVFKGTSVISGTATVVAVVTGKETDLGKIETGLGAIAGETAFEKGIRQFGYMLLKIALLLAGIIIIINISAGKNPLDSILFALVLSVGLTPELLPAIVTITLSAGSRRLARKKVIVKKLSSIQNLGAIDILCTDKTGTLTEGEVKIHSCILTDGLPDELLQKYAYLNAYFESGYPNPMDNAIRDQLKTNIAGYEKFDEVPYDFVRKRLSIVVEQAEKHVMVTKGALKNVLEVCKQVHLRDGRISPIKEYKDRIRQLFEEYSANAFRVIGLAYKDVTDDPVITKEDETEMIFMGFILLFDPPRKDIAAVMEELKKKNITLKVITGDNMLIAKNIAAQIGIPSNRIISGKELYLLSEDAITGRVDTVDIFSETEPSQKERIIRAFQKKGHVVGYLGDGINDASALKIADVGISVNNAVDVAKEAAHMILMEKDLSVISDGITEGRKTYLNTLKYIFITISANFGNMFSMAGASIFLPFLPLLPSQVLLTNFLTDIPALSITSDKVDEELLQKPRNWNIALIRKFMIVFGIESSMFDFLTFTTLLFVFHASAGTFRTGWFVESVITEIMILLIIRTRRTFTKSRIGKMLLFSSIGVGLSVLIIPFIPVSSVFGFVSLPIKLLLTMCLISGIYVLFAEVTKKIIFRKINY